MKKVLIPISEGFEEIETVSLVDILRRAGVEVVLAGLDSLEVKGAHDIRIKAEILLKDVVESEFDMIILPGGLPNAQILAKSEMVLDLLKNLIKRKNI